MTPRMRVLAAPIAMAMAVGLGACSSDGAGPDGTSTATDAIRVVSPQQANALLAEDPAPVVIDVRTPQEFAAGHLEGAQLVDFNGPDFRAAIGEYPRDASYVIYCRSGNRSEGARRIMAELGFTDVVDIDGGIVAWTDAGLPVTT